MYTQVQMKALVEFARSRHITIVPEIEMPGHAQAAIAAYPEYGCTDSSKQVSPYWGIHPALFNPYPGTLAFLQDVLREVMEIFPSKFIHIGGDEAVKAEWIDNPTIQDFIRENSIDHEAALQSFFIERMVHFVTSTGQTAASAGMKSWRENWKKVPSSCPGEVRPAV